MKIEYPQHTFLRKTIEIYPIISIKYPPYQFSLSISVSKSNPGIEQTFIASYDSDKIFYMSIAMFKI